MNKSESITALAAALAKAQAAIQPAIKDKKNEAFKNGGKVSKYADLASVWDACREPLTSNGLSVVQMPVDAEPGRIALTTVLMHASGEFISSTVSTRLVNDTPQGVGSGLTYLRRYALSAMVGVVADEDDDGNAASQPQREASYQPERAPLASEQPRQNGNGGALASDRQIGLIKGITRGWKWSEADTLGYAAENNIRAASLAALTSRQASDLITLLKAEADAVAQQSEEPR